MLLIGLDDSLLGRAGDAPAVYDFARPLLFGLDPEQAHELTLKALEAGIYPRAAAPDDPRLAVERVGSRLPQSARPGRRLRQGRRASPTPCWPWASASWRSAPSRRCRRPAIRARASSGCARDRALINRLGFNNAGHAAALARPRSVAPPRGIVGVNVGANKDAADRVADYVAGRARLLRCAELLHRQHVLAQHARPARPAGARPRSTSCWRACRRRARELVAAGKPSRPMVVKLAPDIAEADLEPIVEVLARRGVDGIAVSNTTLARDGLTEAAAAREAGGLSGRPLFHRSTAMLARVYMLTAGPPAADRHRRHRLRRGGHRQDRGGRHAAAALHRPRLRGPRPHRPHQGRPRRLPAAREPAPHRRRRRPPRRPLGRGAGRQ